jgi:TetR/AcrR family transcriptional regulator, transcriptional repressor for nem operon
MMKSATRERLVEAARTLFWKHGYASTGIARILKEADVGSGSLYYFFPTKEDLLLAVLEWYRDNLWTAVVQPVFDRLSDPIERIFGILDGYRRGLLMTNYQHGCSIGNLALELADNHLAARQLLAVNFTGWRKFIEQCLSEAADRLPDTVDRDQLALFVLTTMEGAVMLARTYQNTDPYDAAVTQLRDYFDRLLRDGANWSMPRPLASAAFKPKPENIRKSKNTLTEVTVFP